MTGKTIIKDIGSTFRHPIKSVTHHPVRTAAVAGGVFLLVNFIMSPKGDSLVAKATRKVLPHGGPRRIAAAPPRAALPAGGPAAAAAQRAAAAGYFAGAPFGPGWGRGFMPYQYGAHWQETPAEIAAAHREWAAASGGYPDVWTQSSYPWS